MSKDASIRRERKDALYGELAAAGKALASPRRLELLEVLAQAPRSVEALAEATGLTVANASAHLQVLRQGGLVTPRKDGTRVWYRLAGDDVAELLVRLRAVASRHVAGVAPAAQAYLATAWDGGQEVDGAEAGGAAGAAEAGAGDVDDALEGEPVDKAELAARIERGEVVVVDVRPPEEHAAGHIPGAWSVPVDELPQRLAELPDDVEIVAYCRGPYCVFSSQAVALLRAHGRTARRLADGLPEWRLAGHPVEEGADRA